MTLPRLSLGLRIHYRKLTALGVYRERWPRIKVMTWNDEVPKFSNLRLFIGLWCNGSTTDFGSVCLSSNLGSPTKKNISSNGGIGRHEGL